MKNETKKALIIGIFTFALLFTIFEVTYATVRYSKEGTRINQITMGTITMVYKEGNTKISIDNAMPMEDAVGKTLNESNQVFDFGVDAVVSQGNNLMYEITASKDISSTLGNNDVKLYLERSEDGTTYTPVSEPSYYTPLADTDSFGAPGGDMIIDTGTLTKSVNYSYRLRMWIAKEYKMTGDAKTFTVRVNVYSKNVASD